MDDTAQELFDRARKAVYHDGEPLPPVVAWVCGYAAGHRDAISKAIQIMEDAEFPFTHGETPDCGEWFRTFGGMKKCQLPAGHDGKHHVRGVVPSLDRKPW